LGVEACIRGWGLAEKEALIRGDGSAVQRLVKKRQTGAPAEPVADPLVQPVLAGQRRAMAKAITLLESTRADHRARAEVLLTQLLPHAGRSLRLGISGVPGVGKSTFIEALGLALVAQGRKVAVLAIDPSSSINGGSILGDKTRMEQLASHPSAFIRPSPASGTLGGVAAKTREAMLVVEAAGFDVVIVETVGVGQSETAVASMTDLFVLLQLPNAGDDLQAMKRGVMELADMVVINKADMNPDAASQAQAQIVGALRLTHSLEPGQVLCLSALRKDGLDAFWLHVERFEAARRADGRFAERRRQQAQAWMWDLVRSQLLSDFLRHPVVSEALGATEAAVVQGHITPGAAARSLLYLFERPKG
jgi:LAO/AO transport system kinase